MCTTICTVTDECLEYALADTKLDFGVWGGMTVKQRQKERRRRRDAASQAEDSRTE